MGDPIADVMREGREATAEILHGSIHRLLDGGRRMSTGEILDIVAGAAYQSGLEIGLQIAVSDVAAGRRMIDWIQRNIMDGDPRGTEAREHNAANYLRVLSR